MPWSRRSFLSLFPLAGVALPELARAGEVSRRVGGDGRGRARELGVRIGHHPPGPLNAITDLAGVRVGHATVIRGEGPLVPGEGPVRTGVTAIWPGDFAYSHCVPCGAHAPNGNGELSGIVQAERLGVFGSPILLTGTTGVGAVYDAAVRRIEAETGDELPRLVPIVGETWDGELSDVVGRHVTREHVTEAIDSAAGGAVREGAVGGGTGMISYGFKGGIGTSSRRLEVGSGTWTIGALVQANHGRRHHFRIDGVPVGEAIQDLLPGPPEPAGGQNSILMIVGTDAPLLPHQLARIARRATHGLAKTGSISSNSSGDFAFAFSTADPIPREAFWKGDGYRLRSLEQFDVQPLLEGAAEAVEEAIVNALFAAENMIGRDGNRAWALPLDRTLDLLERYGRLHRSEEGP